MKKKISAILATLMLGTVLVGCGSSNEDAGSASDVTTTSIVQTIKENIEMRKTGPVEGEMLTEQFFLNMDDVEEATIENGMMNSGLETVAVVKAKDGKVDSVKESLEKVKEAKSAAAFYPGESEAVEAAEIVVVGNYVGLFIIPGEEEGQNHSQDAVKLFEDALK